MIENIVSVFSKNICGLTENLKEMILQTERNSISCIKATAIDCFP